MTQKMAGGDFTPPQQAEFDRLARLVQRIIPEVEQVMSYGMPTFRYKSKIIFHVGAFRDHMSIFPGPGAVVAFADQLGDYKTSKGTIQFTLEQPLPDTLVSKIVDFRIRDIDNS